MDRRHPLRMLNTPFSRLRHVTPSLRRSVAALAPLAGWLSLASACAVDAEPERLGFTDDHLVVTDDSAAATPADFSGRWRGQAIDLLALDTGEGDPEEFRFASGSSDITLEIRIDANDALGGVLVFGSAEAPPATDPLASYPPGATLNDYEENPAALEGAHYQLSEQVFNAEIAGADRLGNGPGGFQGGSGRSLADGDNLLRLLYRTSDAYAGWCALQPSLRNVGGGLYAHNCLGALGVAQADDGRCYSYDGDADFTSEQEGSRIIADPAREVDCARAFACLEQCFCYPPDLYSSQGLETPADFVACGSGGTHFGEVWLRRAGADLVGVLTGEAGFSNAQGARTALGTIRFTRLPEP